MDIEAKPGDRVEVRATIEEIVHTVVVSVHPWGVNVQIDGRNVWTENMRPAKKEIHL